MVLLSNLKTNSEFSKFQFHMGGQFPRETYDQLIRCCERLLRYTSLIGYASATFSQFEHQGEEMTQWSSDFRRLVTSINATSHQITSLLALLSSSISSGTPLPPYTEMPKPFQVVKKLESIDADLLSIRHIAEPEYSAFAVLQICAQCITQDVKEAARYVALIGALSPRILTRSLVWSRRSWANLTSPSMRSRRARRVRTRRLPTLMMTKARASNLSRTLQRLIRKTTRKCAPRQDHRPARTIRLAYLRRVINLLPASSCTRDQLC